MVSISVPLKKKNIFYLNWIKNTTSLQAALFAQKCVFARLSFYILGAAERSDVFEMGSTLRLRQRWGGCRLTRQFIALFYQLSSWSLGRWSTAFSLMIVSFEIMSQSSSYSVSFVATLTFIGIELFPLETPSFVGLNHFAGVVNWITEDQEERREQFELLKMLNAFDKPFFAVRLDLPGNMLLHFASVIVR